MMVVGWLRYNLLRERERERALLVGVVVAIGGVVIVVVVGWLRCNMLGELGRERDTEVCERERETNISGSASPLDTHTC